MQIETTKMIGTACPKCKTKMKIPVPMKAGLLPVTCPNGECGHLFKVNISQEIIQKLYGDTTAQQQSQQQQSQISSQEQVADVSSSSTTGQKESVSMLTEPHKMGGVAGAVLAQKRPLFLPDRIYRLKEGSNTIGRDNADMPSDIMVKDKTVSRRSVTITVERMPNDRFKYFVTVNKTLNPVYVNGKAYPQGSSFELKVGDTFQLGLTRFTLKPKKK